MVDGTNNGCERAIGWWDKERYRTMRGYKRPQSVVNVSLLLAELRHCLRHPEFDPGRDSCYSRVRRAPASAL